MAKDRSWKEYAAWIIGGMALLSYCGNTIDNMSATGKGTIVAGTGAAAAGGAAGYGCSKVGLKTCLGGGGGGGGGDRKPAATEDTTPATTPPTAPPDTAPPATTPPTAPPVTLIPRPPTPTPNTTPGGLHLPDGVTLDRTGMDTGPGVDLAPCIVGGVGQIGMSQC